MFASLCGAISQPFAALPSQSTKPALHTCAHADAAHTGVAFVRVGQTLPHEPQFDGSLAVFAHEPLQVMRPAAHVVVHTPIEHTWPPGHTVPHAPQLASSVCVLLSQPFAAFASQFAKPALHAPSTHPRAQVEAAFAKLQTIPQPVQLLGSKAVEVSQPSAPIPLQLPKPIAHVSPHEESAQNGVAFGPVGHVVPHAPQFAGSVATLRHEPLQSISPAPHVVAQAPIEQT